MDVRAELESTGPAIDILMEMANSYQSLFLRGRLFDPF
jgi:hypothetical protein